MGFLHARAIYWVRRCRFLEVEDLVSYGVFGVLRGIEMYEPGHGASFLTYAGKWIDAYIRKNAEGLDGIMPANPTVQSKLISGELGKTWRELAAAGLSVEQIHDALCAKYGFNLTTAKAVERSVTYGPPRSLDATFRPSHHEDAMFTEKDSLVAVDEPADAALEGKELRARVREVLATVRLSDRERAILNDRLLSDEDITLRDIGERFGCTRERIRQIEAALLVKLRKALADVAA